MEKGIRIKYIAAAMSEILGIDVPCDDIRIIPNEITKVRGVGFKSSCGCYLYLNHVLSPDIVEKLAEKIRDKEEKNLKERFTFDANYLKKLEDMLTKGCIEMIKTPYCTNPTEIYTDDFLRITDQMHDTYIKKNHDYGNSFDKSIDELGIVAAVTRMSDKMERLKSLVKKESEVKDESFTDTVLDLANYAVMTAMYLKNHEDKDGTDNK